MNFIVIIKVLATNIVKKIRKITLGALNWHIVNRINNIALVYFKSRLVSRRRKAKYKSIGMC